MEKFCCESCDAISSRAVRATRGFFPGFMEYDWKRSWRACVAEMNIGLCHDSRFLQASVGEFARTRIPRSTSELRAERRNWYALWCLSISSSVKPHDLICAYVRAGSAIGTSRLPSETSPNPQQSANVVVSLRNDRNFSESLSNAGGFNFYGKVMGSPAELKSLVPAIGRGWCACLPTAEGIGWCCLLARKGARAEKGCEFGTAAAAAAVAAAAAPVVKTATARIMTMLPAATAVQAG